MAVIIFRQDDTARVRPLLLEEIGRGRLRQGWSWHSSFNLFHGQGYFVKSVREHPFDKGPTSRKEAVKIHRKIQRMLEIRSGDLLIVPRQPKDGQCVALVAATNSSTEFPYRFTAPLKDGEKNRDFRHCIDVVPWNGAVFTRSMACRLPLVEKALWGNGGYQSPVNFVQDELAARALASFVKLSPGNHSSAERMRAPGSNDLVSLTEGKRIKVYGTIYERNPKLRRKAIEIHGLDCQGCGFNFERFYGEHGEGFAHVHHLKPLSQLGKPQKVDARRDLSVLCVNCHVMVHRQREHTLTLSELRALIMRSRSR